MLVLKKTSVFSFEEFWFIPVYKENDHKASKGFGSQVPCVKGTLLNLDIKLVELLKI